MNRWDFLTHHAHVLVCVAQDPGVRLRDIAASVGITERGAHKILSELVEEGYVQRERHGRRNRYQVMPDLPLRHPLVQEQEVGQLLEVLLRQRRAEPRAVGAPGRRASAKSRSTDVEAAVDAKLKLQPASPAAEKRISSRNSSRKPAKSPGPSPPAAP